MLRLQIQLRPLTDFASPLVGGMLFGHLAWAVRETSGEERLTDLLEGYTEGRPFAVLSDVFPSGHVPVPALPPGWWQKSRDPKTRKMLKKKKWLPVSALKEDSSAWENLAESNEDLREKKTFDEKSSQRQHNTISRATNTTGEDGFAPYSVPVKSFSSGTKLDLYAVLDEKRLGKEEFLGLLERVGSCGYGRDASTGLGKFEVVSTTEREENFSSKHWVSLSAMSPQSGLFQSQGCFYRPLTYYGRHGNVRALGGMPFKKPILLVDTGAYLTTQAEEQLPFAGRGITGHSVYADTVHQGYAPLLPILGGD